MEKTSYFDITKSVLLIIVVIFLFFKFNHIVDAISSKPTQIPTTYIEQVATNAVRAQVAENKKEFNALLTEMKAQNSAIMELAKKDDGRIEELASMYGQLKGEIAELNSTFTYKDEERPERDLVSTQLSFEKEEHRLPIGEIYYSPNIEEDPWVFNPYPINYHVDIIQTEGDTHNRYIEMYADNRYTRGEKYPITLDAENVNWVKRPIKDKKLFFPNFRLGLSGAIDINSAYPSINLSTFSYGKTKGDMDWRFLSFGIGGNSDNVCGYITPIEYNIGKPIPMIDNLFLGPSYMINIGGGVDDISNGFGASMTVPF